ncbi:hypothetical protein [Zooshikella harenae]|uniref:DUF4124 domain-containing protein n=1 Tax=Zooshikella harenae TaxID=2827238 RepID=A0ABS5ZFF8_9GAMM|nr:hypothetical protein [Zooshikella harenae]MBU2712804.1 hypothetical protein [Zooshikella harenae]
MMQSHIKWGLIFAITCSLLTGLAWGAEPLRFYRFVDESGNLVISNSIPPHLAAQGGYTVIDDKGRVLEKVPKALTPEQLIEKKQQDLIREALEQQRAQQEARDKTLLTLYSSTNDIERAMRRQVSEIEDKIKTIEGDIRRTQQNKGQKEEQAANFERSGRQVPKRILDDIKQLDEETKRLDKEIERRRKEQEEVREKFAKDIERFRMLTGEETPEVPEPVDISKEDLHGIWISGAVSEMKHELILTQKGSLTWVANAPSGVRTLSIGSWKPEKQALLITVNSRQVTDQQGKVALEQISEQKRYPVKGYQSNIMVLEIEGKAIPFSRSD